MVDLLIDRPSLHLRGRMTSLSSSLLPFWSSGVTPPSPTIVVLTTVVGVVVVVVVVVTKRLIHPPVVIINMVANPHEKLLEEPMPLSMMTTILMNWRNS